MSLESSQKKRGLILGGSGLIGGAITHYFKTLPGSPYELMAPNSKKLSLRVPEDIKQYLQNLRPDFIINTAITSLGSGPLITFETNYLGSINLAKAAIATGTPYIHFSSAATMPSGLNLKENDNLNLNHNLSNYAKSKLMTELTLEHMRKTMGLDYTIVRLGIVYGKHDHKIQGFQRLFFSIADKAMPVMLTKPDVAHSYTHNKKLPPFIHYILENRPEFTGQTYNFVDTEPVGLAQVILEIKKLLHVSTPKEIYVPYRLSKITKDWLTWIVKKMSRIGIKATMPAEMQFLDNFYRSQTLSADKLINSSYGARNSNTTVFSTLPTLLEYYLTRWVNLNLLSPSDYSFLMLNNQADEFLNTPEQLLNKVHHNMDDFVPDYSQIIDTLKK